MIAAFALPVVLLVASRFVTDLTIRDMLRDVGGLLFVGALVLLLVGCAPTAPNGDPGDAAMGVIDVLAAVAGALLQGAMHR
jgi:hypothetical protein